MPITCTRCASHFERNAAQTRKPTNVCLPCERVRDRARRAHLTRKDRITPGYEAVTESGCFIWTGRTKKNGYGFMITSDGKYAAAHRAAWAERNGAIPAGMFVCHKCDTPICVNPDHLFLGTPKDNTVDMWRKGRARPFGRWPRKQAEAQQQVSA